MGYDWTADALKFAQARLQRDPSAVENVDWELEIRAIGNRLASQFDAVLAPVGGIENLSDSDQLFWAEGVGLMTAIRLRQFLARTTVAGDVTAIKLVDQQFNFSGSSKAKKPVEQQWLEDALLAIGRVTPIKAMYQAAAAAFCPFMLSGPTRAAKATGLHETLMSGLVRLLTDDWNADTDSQSGVGI
jgi:hypothetical protein